MLILNRYLLGEIAVSVLGVAAMLLITTLSIFFANTLTDVATGRLPVELLFPQIGLRSLAALTVLVPLSMFLGIMVALGRLYRDNEMAVLMCAGMDGRRLFRSLALLVTPFSLALVLISLWLSPWAMRTSLELRAEAKRTATVAGLEAGQFQEIGDGVVYVETIAADGQTFRNVFIHRERAGRVDIVRAAEGRQYINPDTQQRYIALLDGTRTEGSPGSPDYRLMRFARNDIKLPEVVIGPLPQKMGGVRLLDLLRADDAQSRAELHWRFGPPIAVVLLTMLAVPLSRTSPREGRMGRLLLGVTIYIIYANLLGIGRVWIEHDDVPHWFGLWWVHIAIMLAALWLSRRRWRGSEDNLLVRLKRRWNRLGQAQEAS